MNKELKDVQCLLIEIRNLNEQLKVVQCMAKGLAIFGVTEGDILLAMEKEIDALRLQLESANNENAYLHKQVEMAMEALIRIKNDEIVGTSNIAIDALARLEEAKNG